MSVKHSPPPYAGLDDSSSAAGGMRRQHSSSSLQSAVGPCGSSSGIDMNVSRVHAMRRSISEHANAVSRLLLTSKDSSDRRFQIESAFRSCKEAFFELSTLYLYLLEERKNDSLSPESVKNIITQALSQFNVESSRENHDTGSGTPRSYASVTRASVSAIKIARGPAIPVKKSTNILVIPKKDTQEKFASSKETKETFKKIIKPVDFNLKVNRIMSTRNKGVRIEAFSGDIDKIKNSKELDKAGLEIKQFTKLRPRLILHDVPVDMSREDLKTELIALNLDRTIDTDVDVIYIFPPKRNRAYVSCIIEVFPAIRAKLLTGSHVYINYSTCRLEDYVRVLQCYKCLAFGHISKNCSAASLCGHCAEAHEMKDCPKKDSTALCGNCKRWMNEEQPHSALDGKTCPILRKRLEEKIKNINYG
ncbi:uncharacterized protein LOC109860519 [Pseudomyrmex gracilis]|uniref:uncharacterized protein LOC109860519 n=1 Tax=Pseudomyrmex gracilis TaxID=219809 RepID=UPI0009948F35|nr:uncharacterized protein LOC109860519 [Pseudomyrmex gracilis]